MPVSHPHKAILVHVPKTAGTSMEYVLGMHGPKTKVGVEAYIHQQRDTAHLFGAGLQHMTARELRTKLGDALFARYFVFAFVRNPWDRVVSDAAWSKGKWVKKQALTQATFNAYVASLKQNAEKRQFSGHQRPQYEFVCDGDGKVIVDFIGRYEQLDADWAQVCAQLKLDVLPLPIRMQSKHNTDYRKYYTPATRALVAQIYAKDIALFNYTF